MDGVAGVEGVSGGDGLCVGGEGDAVDELEEGLVSEGFLPEGGVDEEVFVDVDAEVACGSGGRGRKVEVVEELG